MQRLTGTITIILLALFTSCGQRQDNREVSEQKTIESIELESDTLTNEQRHYFDTTLTINNRSFRLLIQDINEDEITLTFFREYEIIKIDTLESGGLGNIEFVDFNKDSYSDFLITYIGNVATYDLYLFDEQKNQILFLDGFRGFPEATQLETNKKYYYSYHRAGCADMNWVSDLFYIDNFKTVHVGHIYGQGCDYEVKDNSQTIEIYKVIDNDENKKIKVEKLPYLNHITKFGDKWTFIEKYWNKNYKKYD